MADIKYKNDYEEAQRICDELKKKKTTTLNKIFSEYDSKAKSNYYEDFIRLASSQLTKKEITDPHEAITVVHNFWDELRRNPSYICNYKGTGPLNLKGYLIYRLIDRCKDKIKQITNYNKKYDRSPYQKNDISDEENITDKASVEFSNKPQTPVERLMQKEKALIIRKALLQLEKKDRRAAYYVKMKLDGLTYKAMAQRKLPPTSSEETIKKRTNTIKKRFTRPGGCLEKFGKIVKKNM